MFQFPHHRVSSWVAGSLLFLLPLGASAVKRVAAHSTAHARTAHTTASARGAGRGRSVVVSRGGTAARRRNVVVLLRGRHGRLVRARYAERFSAPSFAQTAENTSLGDQVAGEDPLVRASLLEALGLYNGTALAIDPKNGRILAMVNQKQALGPGAEPCSTIKLMVSLAALSEGLINKDTQVNVGGGYRLNLTYALARSVNPYFETLGRQMGFETVKHYANQFGLGELAGYNIAGEQLGVYPDHELPAKLGGVGKMCSFGESIQMTPMQLGALVVAIANGGSLFYLQHPTTPEQVAAFEPRLKRTLDIQKYIPEMLPGMEGAVEATYGTARSLRTNFHEFPVFGKTGTCSDHGTRFGWFAGYGDGPSGRTVTVFFLTGGKPTFGPKAAELTGVFYRALASRSYFQQHAVPVMTDSAVTAPAAAPPPVDSNIPATEPTAR